MKKLLFVALVAVLFLTGCVEYGITIKVNKDGSGQIVEKMLLSNQIMNMAKAMNPGEDGVKAFTKEKQMEKAPQFGESVAFDSMKEISTESKQGYEVIYKFADITKIMLSQDTFSESVESMTEGMSMGEGDDMEEEDEEEGIDSFFTFEYNKKGKLVINNGFSKAINEAKKEEIKELIEEEEEMTDQELEQSMAMAKMFVQGMKFSMKLEFDNVKDANVPYENNQITLFEIDMSKVMKDEATFKEIMRHNGEEITKIFTNEKKVDGITFQDKEEITVNFK